MIFNDTIVALATAPGKGAIHIIRISGKDSITIADRIFRGKSSVSRMPSGNVRYGKIIEPETSEIIDQVLITVFRSPNSYTGLDTIEISCHGGPLNAALIIELILKYGARYAEPGEFTKLAFLNGKMDLTQVEAVADIIYSKTRLAHRSSVLQINGSLSEELKQMKNSLIHIASLLELDLDFGEEQLFNIDHRQIETAIHNIIVRTEKLIASYQHGHLLRDGAKITITGKPNVGKSSLLNALLQKERAIVSEIPGTTRDYLEESIDIGGIPFILTDTAGIRSGDNPIEKRGIEIARKQIHDGDLVLFVMDASSPLESDDIETFRIISEAHGMAAQEKMIVVKNKIDLGVRLKEDFVEKNNFVSVSLSIKNGQGIELLKETIKNKFIQKNEFDSVIITNIRHKILLEKCNENLNHALESLRQKLSFEFIAMDVRHAVDSIKEMTGEITREDILNNIFMNFCVGK